MCDVFILKCSNGIVVFFFLDMRLCCVGRYVCDWGLYLLYGIHCFCCLYGRASMCFVNCVVFVYVSIIVLLGYVLFLSVCCCVISHIYVCLTACVGNIRWDLWVMCVVFVWDCLCQYVNVCVLYIIRVSSVYVVCRDICFVCVCVCVCVSAHKNWQLSNNQICRTIWF